MNPGVDITKAVEADYRTIVKIGNISVRDAHQESCSVEDMDDYLGRSYNDDAIKDELTDPANIYYLIHHNNNPVGFSKINLNAGHENIQQQNVTKLDRIYLLKEFHGLKLGIELLNFNIELAKSNGQSGMWLYTWVGNAKAINFYHKVGFKVIGNAWFKVSERHSNEQYQMFLEF